MGDKVYVLGGAQTDFERNWSKEGKNVIALLKEVVSDALSEVKLTYEDIRRLNCEIGSPVLLEILLPKNTYSRDIWEHY